MGGEIRRRDGVASYHEYIDLVRGTHKNDGILWTESFCSFLTFSDFPTGLFPVPCSLFSKYLAVRELRKEVGIGQPFFYFRYPFSISPQSRA